MKSSNYYKIFIFLLVFSLHGGFSQSVDADAAELRAKVVASAKQYAGVPYVWGGTTAMGMDCSGFIYTVANESVGMQLPRTAAAMYGFTRIVPDSKKEIGDILFFKTTGAGISHAGIYIGNNQFIHSASDGPNTGVIISSLNQTTWKNTYAGVGQFLPPSNLSAQPSIPAGGSNLADGSESIEGGTTSPQSGWNTFLQNVSFDFSATMLWNFYTSDSFLFNVRGATLQAHARYTKGAIQPGFGIELRIEPRMGIVQIPLHFSVSVPHGFRVYAGPVFTIGKPKLIGNKKRISASIFPGILGVSWQSPGFKVGITEISFIQDITWVVFNKTDNSALNFAHSIVAGLSFSTGVRVTINGANLIK